METIYPMLSLLFALVGLLMGGMIALGVLVSFKFKRVLAEIKSIKTDLLLHSQNLSREMDVCDEIQERVVKLTQEISRYHVAVEGAIERKLNEKIDDLTGAKKTHDERRWDSLKEAFKQPKALVNNERSRT